VKNLILAINPGTTTTRCALFEILDGTLKPVTEVNFELDEKRMAAFPTIASQLDYRAEMIERFVAKNTKDGQLVACAGRGGMLTPVPSGVIEINDDLVEFALHTPVYHHASNLGAPLAHVVAKQNNIAAYIVDPVSVDELSDIARVSGLKDIPRFSFVHALNIRACGRRLATQLNKPFGDVRAVVAHLGAGFSIATLLNGKLVDSSNRMEVSPFTPERAGGLPPLPLIELCYSQKYTKEELLSKLYGQGGVFSYLGTKDIRAVEALIAEGNEQAKLIYDAMLYQVGRAIGAMASVADFELDGVILTGGLANSKRVQANLTQRCQSLAPVHIFPGSDECQALAEGAGRVLFGEEIAFQWPVTQAGSSQ